MFTGIDMTGAKQNGKQSHKQRYNEGGIHFPGLIALIRKAVEGRGYRLQLLCDVRQNARDGHQSDENCQGLGFSISRGNKISDGRYALLFANGDDFKYQR